MSLVGGGNKDGVHVTKEAPCLPFNNNKQEGEEEENNALVEYY